MFAALFLDNKKRGFYKIKCKYFLWQKVRITFVLAPVPKNAGQLKKLKNALSEYKGRVILTAKTKIHSELEGYLYNGENFMKRVLAEAFFTYVKKQRPKAIAIFDDGFLNLNYYKTLSTYTDGMYLECSLPQEALAEEILKESGIVIWRKNLAKNGTAFLNLDKDRKETFLGLDNKIFDVRDMENLSAELKTLLPKELKELSPFSVLSFLFYQCGERVVLESAVKIVLSAQKYL